MSAALWVPAPAELARVTWLMVSTAIPVCPRLCPPAFSRSARGRRGSAGAPAIRIVPQFRRCTFIVRAASPSAS